MSYSAYITRIKNVRKHPNADRLQLGECFGNTVCVDSSYTDNQLGIYFPTDGKLGVEFAEKNNLLRKKDGSGNNVGGYMDPDKRNIKAIKLRGEKSDGLFLPLASLETFCTISDLKEGDKITILNGVTICEKYVPKRNRAQGNVSEGNKTRKKRTPLAPLFVEHADTEQFAYNLGAYKCGDEVEITLKMHGTSQRTGYLPVLSGYAGIQLAHDIRDRKGIFRFFKPTDRMVDWAEKNMVPLYDWGYVSGTRRVVLESDGGFYGSNAFRTQHSEVFEGKLWKGEEVFYEVVGFTDTGASIMGTVSNKKAGLDKDFAKQYGEETVFSYGCSPDGVKDRVFENGDVEYNCVPQSAMYVYRMTMTNEDGDVVEYTPDFMRYRCDQMGVKTVPVLWRGRIPEHPGSENDPTISAGEWIKNVAEQFYDGPDPIGKSHVREGVVVRIVNKPKFCAYKHKNFSFKVLEGIIKEAATAPDIEEAEELEVEYETES